MCYGVRVKRPHFFNFWVISQNCSSAKNHETTSKTEAIFWNLKENWRKESAFIFWIESTQKNYDDFNMLWFFLKTHQKKCSSLAMFLSDIDHSEHLTSKIWLFLAGNQLYELKCNRWGWCCCCGCGGGQKKIIDIFTYKQRLLSIDMKTKVVQHVKSEWKNEMRVWEWLLSIEMKTKVVQHVKSDSMRDWKSVRVRKSEIVREWDSERVR